VTVDIIQNLLRVVDEQVTNSTLWRVDKSAQSALLAREIQRLHEMIFQLQDWEARLADAERELEAARRALHTIGIEEAKLRYELGLMRSAFMVYGAHCTPCFGVPCNCGFEHEQNRARAGLLRNGISV
jgi:hypothetical protein